MPPEELTSAKAVKSAMAEYDSLGRDEFLRKHGYGRALRYFLREGDSRYDSKAIYGVAYGYEHPEQGPLPNDAFTGGEATVKRRLEALGFEVEDGDRGALPRSDRRQRAWIVRAGQRGESEQLALARNVVVIGWKELPDLSQVESRDQLRHVYTETYPDHSTPSGGQQMGMVFRFVREIQPGDLVVLPLKTQPGSVAVGRVESGYEFRSEPEFANDANHTHRVTWLSIDTPYEAFDSDLRGAFGAQGTVREFHQPDAYARLLAALGKGAASDNALHLVVKWSARFRADTIERHREIAEGRGSVWWGLATKSEEDWHISQEWLDRLRNQISAGTPTHVFVVGETCWRTDLRAIAFSREEIDEELIPPYYEEIKPQRYHLWVELAEFEETDRDTLLRELDPERPRNRGKPVALGNQTNPLFVRMRVEPRVWWVNQGASYGRARAGGYLWAPLHDKIGNTKDHWRTMRQLRVGDIVLNYANTKLRARSGVTGEATASPRPDPEADQAWGDEGLRVEIQYRELTDQIALDSIPNEWRRGEGGPFTKDGAVKQGYLFPVSDNFASRLGAAFPELQIGEGEAEAATRRTEPLDLEQIGSKVRGEGLEIDDATLRRYHLSLNTRRRFVILAGVSGTGKTWLAEAYARAAGARVLVVPVAPNWTTNEDLLGYRNPLDQQYYDTDFSRFLRDAATEYEEHPERPRRYHVILDEMNLARVEYYFAKFLSAMEQRARDDDARVELAPGDTVSLPSNLYVTGTVNVDETTHSFADKVYDRAQLIELPVSRGYLEQQLLGRPYRELLLALWDELHLVAPFAYRVVDEINEYVADAEEMGVGWESALDEQLLQKVLPKIKGTDLRVRGALERFIQVAADRFPLSTAKAELMLAAFTEHGFTSYF
jgi:MoxR-like ATPase